jgi:2-isopropylmalate synthase
MTRAGNVRDGEEEFMIYLYDTTLRDGSQREGVSLTVEDKLRVVERLDALGIPFIEAGYPASNIKDAAFFAQVASLPLTRSRIVAFGSTRRKHICAQDDAGLRVLASVACEVVNIVGKAHAGQVVSVLETDLAENLAMVTDSIAFLCRSGREVHFAAEHYLDGCRFDVGYAHQVIVAAAAAGASVVTLCDTNGGSLPSEVAQAVSEARIVLDRAGFSNVELGIHAHDDTGCAVANSLVAIEAGARYVQGAMNGYGERVGNADLTTLIGDLMLKMDEEVIPRENLDDLTSTAHYIAAVFNDALNPHHPYVGSAAFAHKGGLHAAAQARWAGAYEHVDPTSVGNLAHVVVSELAGRRALVHKAGQFGISIAVDDDVTEAILADIKQREHEGYSYELADGSLALLIAQHAGDAPSYFRLESFRVIADKQADGRVMTEATIKIHVGSERFIATGEGNGPVNALDVALRKAIMRFYPEVASVSLTDYKVRVLDESSGTDAITRVLIQSSDGIASWGTVGVSENIIEASWMALMDSIVYGLMVSGVPVGRDGSGGLLSEEPI